MSENCTKKECRWYDTRANEHCGALDYEEMKRVRCPYLVERDEPEAEPKARRKG